MSEHGLWKEKNQSAVAIFIQTNSIVKSEVLGSRGASHTPGGGWGREGGCPPDPTGTIRDPRVGSDTGSQFRTVPWYITPSIPSATSQDDGDL